VEVQGTAEQKSFSPDELSAMLALAHRGTSELVRLQQAALEPS
jgi:ribonuclease PH